MKPQFSVIIPTRNRENFLNEAVASVLAQNLPDLELLVVNDGLALTRIFSDPRVTVLDNGQSGAVAARNLGVSTAQGEFIAFLDDDDTWLDSYHLDKAASAFAANADFCFANGLMQFTDGSVKLFDHGANRDSLALNNTILISAVSYRKSIHQQLGRFDPDLPYYWDWDWYLRIARAGYKLHHQPQPAVMIRVHGDNMSNSDAASRRANLDALMRKHQLTKIALKNHTDFV